MNTSRSLAVAAMALLFAGAANAQLVKGGKPPSFDFEKVWNDGPAAFDELDGKLVILDFSQTW